MFSRYPSVVLPSVVSSANVLESPTPESPSCTCISGVECEGIGISSPSPPSTRTVVSRANALESPRLNRLQYLYRWCRVRMRWNLLHPSRPQYPCRWYQERICWSLPRLSRLPVPVSVVSRANALESPTPESPPVPVSVVSKANPLESPTPESPPSTSIRGIESEGVGVAYASVTSGTSIGGI